MPEALEQLDQNPGEQFKPITIKKIELNDGNQTINIPLKELHSCIDILLILHEIGHLKFKEVYGFITRNDPIQERYAWAWAIKKARSLKEKYNINLFGDFGNYEDFIKWLHQDSSGRLGSFENSKRKLRG